MLIRSSNPLLTLLLLNSYLFKPSLNIKTGTSFRRQLIMPDNPDIRKTPVKVLYIPFQRLCLPRCPGILRRFPVQSHASSVHDMPAYRVKPGGPVRHFPGINLRVLIVLNQPLDTAVQVYQVRIADLLPATSAPAYRIRMPSADLGRADLTSFRRGGAMDH